MNNNKAWEYALGMIKIDGLEPSKEYLELIEKEKEGTITTDDIRKVLEKNIKQKSLINMNMKDPYLWQALQNCEIPIMATF